MSKGIAIAASIIGAIGVGGYFAYKKFFSKEESVQEFVKESPVEEKEEVTKIFAHRRVNEDLLSVGYLIKDDVPYGYVDTGDSEIIFTELPNSVFVNFAVNEDGTIYAIGYIYGENGDTVGIIAKIDDEESKFFKGYFIYDRVPVLKDFMSISVDDDKIITIGNTEEGVGVVTFDKDLAILEVVVK